MARKPLEGLRLSVNRTMLAALDEAVDRVRTSVEENASLTDHSLDELARLGHPYAVRNPQTIHSPEYQVHQQSGRLRDNIETIKVNQFTYDVGVDPQAVPYLAAVLFGTRTMVARDFIRGSYNDALPDLREIFNKAVTKSVRGAR